MRSNVLFILGGLFAVSMIGRSFAMNLTGSGSVLAMADSIVRPAPADDGDAGLPGVDENRPSPATASEFFEGDACATGPMLEDIRQREASLLEREAEYAERMSTLSAVEQRVEERMAVLDDMNDRLATAMNALEAEADQDITHLASMYENMKPAEASKIFNRMDPTFAAGFLRIMNSTNAGLILAGMEPDKAYSISVVLANRNAGYRDALTN